MRKILITGISHGLGKNLSDYLLEKGFIIYGTTRNSQNLQLNANLKILHLDLTDYSSIDNLVNYFIDSKENIDAIIHNSGIAYLDPADVLDTEECHQIFNVNFFGPLYLTKKFLPILKNQFKSNLIFISSIVSIDHWPYLGVYAASKAALETIAFEWAVLLKKWNIYTSVVQPNPLPTDMQILRSKNTKNSPYPNLNNRVLQWEKIEDVCDIIKKILDSESPEFQYQTGQYSKRTAHRFLKIAAYQEAIKEYQMTFL